MSAEVGDYAFLSDCQTAALVDDCGSVVWWPGESFDGPSVFSKLFDADAGHFDVRPVGRLGSSRRYLPGTLVLAPSGAATEDVVVADDVAGSAATSGSDGTSSGAEAVPAGASGAAHA